MSDIKCKYCGAVNTSDSERCFSCDAPLPKRSNLSEKDKQSLGNYIKRIDGMLKASQEKADGKLIPVFLILSAIGIASAMGFKYMFGENDRTMFVVITLVWSFALFIVFGFFVGKYHNQSMANEFKTKIKFEVKEYLTQMHFTEADFKTVASEVLDEKSNLLKFLPEL